MNLALTLASKLMSLMLIMMTGYVLVKLKLLSSKDGKVLSTIVIYILVPCVIIMSFQIDLTPEHIAGFLAVAVFTAIIYVIWILLSLLLKRPLRLDSVDRMTTVYSNVGNLIIPLVEMTLGSEMVFYAAAMQLPFNLLAYSHCISVIRGDTKIHWKRILLNSNILAVVIGMLLMVFQIRIPGIVATSMNSLAATIGPVSLLAIGMVMAEKDLKSAFLFKKAYLILFLRLLAFPLVGILVLSASGFLRSHPALTPMLLVCFMGLSAPPASSVSQFAMVYDNEPVKASIYNVLGNLLCIFTLPLIIACYQMVFG